MNDSQYNLIAEALLLAIEEAIEDSGVDIDYEGVGGLLTLTFKNNSKESLLCYHRKGIRQTSYISITNFQLLFRQPDFHSPAFKH